MSDYILTSTEILSLVLITTSFLLMAYLVYRAKTVKSFQFQMFVVLLVLTAAEVPHILSSIGVLDISGIEDIGLLVHTVSMIVLVGFISLRVAKYFGQRGGAQ